MNRSFLFLLLLWLPTACGDGVESLNGRRASKYQSPTSTDSPTSSNVTEDDVEPKAQQAQFETNTLSIEGWRCPVSYYGSGDGCDEGCGLMDPDCSDQIEGWSCDDTWYGSGDGCDTDCGIIDPDC